MQTIFCPVQSQNGRTMNCTKEQCGWYENELEMCAVLAISRCLDGILREMNHQE